MDGWWPRSLPVSSASWLLQSHLCSAIPFCHDGLSCRLRNLYLLGFVAATKWSTVRDQSWQRVGCDLINVKPKRYGDPGVGAPPLAENESCDPGVGFLTQCMTTPGNIPGCGNGFLLRETRGEWAIETGKTFVAKNGSQFSRGARESTQVCTDVLGWVFCGYIFAN